MKTPRGVEQGESEGEWGEAVDGGREAAAVRGYAQHGGGGWCITIDVEDSSTQYGRWGGGKVIVCSMLHVFSFT